MADALAAEGLAGGVEAGPSVAGERFLQGRDDFGIGHANGRELVGGVVVLQEFASAVSLRSGGAALMDALVRNGERALAPGVEGLAEPVEVFRFGFGGVNENFDSKGACDAVDEGFECGGGSGRLRRMSWS